MKQHVKHWYEKDGRFFKVLSISGCIDEKSASNLDISKSRLRNMEKDKLIEKKTMPSRSNKNIKSVQGYVLTSKGKKFIEQKYQISRNSSGTVSEQNLKVCSIISKLDKNEIESVRSEWEVRSELEETIDKMRTEGDMDRYDYYMDLWKEGRISAPDITYTSIQTGETISIEVVTSNYSSDDIAAKEMAFEIMEVQGQFERV